MSLALARKYRPTSFDDLVGQDTVSQTLSQALDSNRLSHAYLFSGLRGSGKTSTARIFAKALLCEKGESSHPCDICSNCISSNENRHLDIIEMDAASNRGIDDIKELIEHTKYKPSSARYKIFIIDEVHMLTPQAFNALLKTLEEPPSFVKFILATTDPLKLPATILSRTQHFRFKKIAQKLVLQHLEHILNREGIDYEKDALDIIARSGGGSLRDSLTLLDQAIVYSKNYVDVLTITNMLGIIEPTLLDNLIDNIMNKDRDAILEFIKKSRDYEVEMIIDELVIFIKDILLSPIPKIPIMIIERFFRILSESKILLGLGADGEFTLSLTIFKMMEALEIKEIDSMIKSLESELKGIKITSSPEIVDKIIEDKPIIKDIPIEDTPKVDYRVKFEELKRRLSDRDYDLGECFSNNISFESYEDNKLTWTSKAKDKDKKMLINHWGIIRYFVQDTFSEDTKIINISTIDKDTLGKDTTEEQPTTNNTIKIPIELPSVELPPVKEDISFDDIQMEINSSIENSDNIDFNMEEYFEMKSSCIAPSAGDTESAKEKEPTNILDEPMIQEVISLFDPTKVRVIKKV
ncbi:DNA polymerase III subunits gamma and tau [hydrothermal vent metagenome]|uniref:DNA-directed DNA polymerase n=1 Tax=hydrothermal vent metagenome TaxID=652676 RepID=A0A1W1BMX3_9ZZZZ